MTSTQVTAFGGNDDASASSAVLDAIAAEEGTTPLDFETPLYDVVDPDALDALVDDDRFDGAVEFTYRGYRVSVHADGQVYVDDVDDR